MELSEAGRRRLLSLMVERPEGTVDELTAASNTPWLQMLFFWLVAVDEELIGMKKQQVAQMKRTKFRLW